MTLTVRAVVTGAAILAVVIIAAPCRAAWTVDGDSISVYPCEELPTATVSDGAGGMYVVWSDNRSCNQSQTYVQRILGSGRIAPGWPIDGLAAGPGPGAQSYAQAIPDGAGGAIVAWQDRRIGTADIFAQRIGPAADRLWSSDGVRVCDAGGEAARKGCGVLAACECRTGHPRHATWVYSCINPSSRSLRRK